MSSPEESTGLLRRARWNPYAVGGGIGVLSWIVFYLVDKPLGVTTSLAGLAGACATPVLGGDVIAANAYLDRKSTRLNSSHSSVSRMPSSA